MIDSEKWSVTNILTFTVICISLVIQFVIAVLLIRLGKSQEITEMHNQNMRKMKRVGHDHKKYILPHNNNIVTLLTALITVLNIFVSIFSA